MAYIQPSQTYAKVGKNRSITLITSFLLCSCCFFLVGVALYNDLNSKLLSHNLVYRYTIESWEITLYSQIFKLKTWLILINFCHLLSYKYNVSHLDDSGIKICITKIIFVLLQQLCQEAQINSFQLNGHKNDFKITASDIEKKAYLTLLTLILNFAINLFYILLSFCQPCPTKILGKNIHPT